MPFSTKQWSVWLALLSVFAFGGCDAIRSLVEEDEEAEEQAADSEPSSPPEAGTSPVQDEVVDNSPPIVEQTVTPPTAEEILAAFMAKRSIERNDHDLDQLAQAPELLAGITELDLSGGGITDIGLSYLRLFPDLERVDLSDTRISNEGLAQLASCPKLIAIELDRMSQVDETGVRGLTALPIQELSLCNTSVTEGIFAVLVDFDELHTLSVDGNANLNGTQFRGVTEELSGLKVLSASNTALGFGLQTIGQLSELEVVRIGNTEATDQALEQLAQCRKLVELDASGNPLTDLCAPFLARMRELKILSLRDCEAITDQVLDELGRLEQLERLDLTGTRCSPEGAQSLKERLPHAVVVFDDQEL